MPSPITKTETVAKWEPDRQDEHKEVDGVQSPGLVTQPGLQVR